tara:strand:+ start:30 stop:158 length:129 start_codon:yes stop_codon:yes gene_type:complete
LSQVTQDRAADLMKIQVVDIKLCGSQGKLKRLTVILRMGIQM